MRVNTCVKLIMILFIILFVQDSILFANEISNKALAAQSGLVKDSDNIFSNINIDGIVATAFIIVMAIISAVFYNHKDQQYIDNKSDKIKSPISFRYVYRIIQISTIVGSIGAFLTNSPIFLEIHNNVFVLYIGISIATVAMVLFISAKLSLGEHYSPCFDSYVPYDIVQDGLYKYIRHPIYTSNIILLLGVFIASGSLWILFNLITLMVYYVYSAITEESVLTQKFPRYRDYVNKTSMFLPAPWTLRKRI